MADYPTRTFGVTHPGRDDGPWRIRTRHLAYVATFVVLAALVVSAAVDGVTDVDLWGVSVDHVTAAGGGYEVDVEYPSVTRPALATPFSIDLRRSGGFPGPVDVAVASDWLEMWDFQALYPEPTEWVGEPDQVIFTFEPPDGDHMRVFFDARIQPAQQSGRDGWVTILDSAGDPVARVDFSTTVLP